VGDLHELTALEQGKALRAGDVSPTELTRHYLERIATLDSSVGAFITVTAELALNQARAAERKLRAARTNGETLGPLHGVPIAIKDVVHIEGVRCTQGSAAYGDDISDIDDHVVTRIKNAGLIILGTTNTPEFALPCYTENAVAPSTRNPWSPDHSPGGSSGGSAAAVAAQLAPIAHGTDAGGSVRIPASACGVVGIKPSRGRVSDGPLAHDATGLSVHGAIGRNVGDAAALLHTMAGVMPGDAFTAPGQVLPEGAGQGGAVRVVAMPEPMVPGVTAHADCLQAVQRAAQRLGQAGHIVEEIEMSPDQGVADAFASAWAVHAARVPVDEEDEHDLMPFTRYMRQLGHKVSGIELHAALTTFRGIGQMLADMFFETFDVILTPTLAKPPALLNEFTAEPDQAANFARMSEFMPYTPLCNIAGLPAISVPMHWNSGGLPIGVMLATRYGGEATLVALAADLEASSGTGPRVPELVAR
jgi:amidase